MTPGPGDLIEVRWGDAWDVSAQDLAGVTDMPDEFLVRTIGEVIEDGLAVLRLASHFTPDGQADITSIPQALIKTVQLLDRRDASVPEVHFTEVPPSTVSGNRIDRE